MLANQLLFLDISGGEFMVILIAIFLIFGPKKMPEIARKIGRTMNELKKASSDITREFRDETNTIKNELLSARESVRRETETISRDISEPFVKAGQDLNPDISVKKTADTDPYANLKGNNDSPAESKLP
ncbi:MAG: twin-arginine translocase TatA/TatE family subunit [Lentimicrobium sp.]|nr:twin-arginine translocase TatA/TatE family subunit [Lentimicrobium sp.]